MPAYTESTSNTCGTGLVCTHLHLDVAFFLELSVKHIGLKVELEIDPLRIGLPSVSVSLEELRTVIQFAA